MGVALVTKCIASLQPKKTKVALAALAVDIVAKGILYTVIANYSRWSTLVLKVGVSYGW